MSSSVSGYDPSPRRRAPRWTLLVLAAIALVALAHHVRSAIDIIGGLRRSDDAIRAPFSWERDTAAVLTVRPEAEAAGLAGGDLPVRIGSTPYRGLVSASEAMRELRAGDTLEIVFRRPGSANPLEERTARIRLEPARRPGESQVRGWLAGIFIGVLGLVMPFFGTLLGLWATAARPSDRRAWILLGLMLGFGQLVQPEVASWEPGLREAGAAFTTALKASWPIFMLLFGLYFPEPFRAEQRRPWLKWIPISIVAAGGLLDTVLSVGNLEHQAAMAPVLAVQRVVRWPALAVSIACIGSFFASLAMKTSFASNPDSKRRLRLLRAGSTAALTPLFGLVLYGLATKRLLGELPIAVLVAIFLPIFLFPLTLAYVIVVERAMDVRVALRMGARYLLVKSGLRVLVFFGMLPLGWLVFRVLLLSRAGAAWKVAGIAALIVLIVVVRRRVARALLAIDRRFFRDAYNEEQVLTELGEQVRTIVEAGPLLETVSGRIADSLHIARIGVFAEEGGGFVLAHGRGLDAQDGQRFSGSSRTAEVLRAARGPVGVYFDDPASWVNQDGGVPAEERGVLESLGTQILLPLAARGNLLGMISLGPKLSEQPYSRTDLRLLRNVAAQAGLALENCRLTSEIVRETAQRARLNREIEIAREVQERLFPQQIPNVLGLECAGTCRPASRVGGDYFDFLSLPGGGLGIAIGDISGKGIPAALLMASLQASLRGQTLDGTRDLSKLMARVNRLVHDASPDNRYATFFYAQFDPATKRLDYVNAGHNPPFLFRGDGSEVVRLKEGGMVVGLMPDAEFTQNSVTLRPGDTFVGFTDGISEAMNAEDEEWGEARLEEVFRAAGGELGATHLIERILERADGFVAGAPQYDDMTLVVVRVLPA